MCRFGDRKANRKALEMTEKEKLEHGQMAASKAGGRTKGSRQLK